jgi:Sec-independent protein translocase protein TatA
MEYHGLKIFWTMTVIGGIINILIILAVALLVDGLSSLRESFGNFTTQYGNTER